MTDWLGVGDCGDVVPSLTALVPGGPRTVYRSKFEYVGSARANPVRILQGGQLIQFKDPYKP